MFTDEFAKLDIWTILLYYYVIIVLLEGFFFTVIYRFLSPLSTGSAYYLVYVCYTAVTILSISALGSKFVILENSESTW